MSRHHFHHRGSPAANQGKRPAESRTQGVTALGGEIKELPDGLVVTGKPMLSGGRAEGCNDHRIVMAMAVASLGCEKPVEITDAQSVSKSYPGFFEDLFR